MREQVVAAVEAIPNREQRQEAAQRLQKAELEYKNASKHAWIFLAFPHDDVLRVIIDDEADTEQDIAEELNESELDEEASGTDDSVNLINSTNSDAGSSSEDDGETGDEADGEGQNHHQPSHESDAEEEHDDESNEEDEEPPALARTRRRGTHVARVRSPVAARPVAAGRRAWNTVEAASRVVRRTADSRTQPGRGRLLLPLRRGTITAGAAAGGRVRR
ncbi:hypothetical protein SeLEV6574_g07844 [Synchytrium endobioticum]|uniref:Uncharacterized protein n=1 Tax=Synchytrium endobioticum TaxID=286115 RepID=A0A507CE11_9FUNG|nr:hypothetical protein SeLEV6574_g07844 [Synchytrium endobioticum]